MLGERVIRFTRIKVEHVPQTFVRMERNKDKKIRQVRFIMLFNKGATIVILAPQIPNY